MNWFYCSGIFLLYFLNVNGEYHRDCLVYNVEEEFNKQHWSGEEVTFYAFVMEDDVVNIEINYEGLEETEFFTTLYFSPSKIYSKIIETKDGDNHRYNLTSMPKANDWIEFKISSRNRVINVFYEPNMHEIIHINHTAHAFSNLIIKASNRSSSKDERKWKLSTVNSEIIPLGEDTNHHTFYLKTNPTDKIHLNLKIDNYTETLSQSEYSLLIENTKVTLQPVKNGQKNTPSIISKYVTTLDISSQVGNVTLSVFFQTKPPSVAYEDGCLPNASTIIIILVVIFIICTSIIGLGFKSKTLISRIKEMECPSKSKGNTAQAIENERNIEITEQGDLLINLENNHTNGDP